MNIKSIRLSKDLTQEDLARAVNVKRTTVTMWETGNSFPNAITLKKIAEVLGCSVDDLLKEK